MKSINRNLSLTKKKRETGLVKDVAPLETEFQQRILSKEIVKKEILHRLANFKFK